MWMIGAEKRLSVSMQLLSDDYSVGMQYNSAESKNHMRHISIAGRMLILHYGIPNKIVISEFHSF